MAHALEQIRENVLAWLLEPENPSVRYLTLRNLLDRPHDDPDVQAAREAIMTVGPVPQILALQHPDGWWATPDEAHSPMYRNTVWQLIFLAELHADPAAPQIRRGGERVLHALQAEGGDFPPTDRVFHKSAPSDCACTDGLVIRAFLRLGYADDARIERAVRFLIKNPVAAGFRCRFNGGKPCAWGAVKTLRALVAVPEASRTPEIQAAIQANADFLLDGDLAHAAFPTRVEGGISKHWFQFGFPRSFQSDMLETLDALADAGYAADSRARPALAFVLSKRRPGGFWGLEQTPKQMPVKLETPSKRKPSKWITLRALGVLKRAGMVTA